VKGKHIVMLVLMALVAVFGAVGYAEEKKTEAQTDAAQTPPPEVAVADVVQKDVPVFQDYVASMDGLVNATILAQVEGYLIKQNYQEGSFVKKGALLFEIDPRPFQASLDVAMAVLAKHEAVLRTAQATLKRILPLAEARAVSQKDKDDAIGSVQAAEAQMLASRAEVRKAELDLSFTKIKSPIDGIAGAANAQIGVAKSLYFPTISLTGAFGTASTDLSDLFTGPSKAWNFGVPVTVPIFTAGRIGGAVKGAEAFQQQALYGYLQAVQNAFREMDDALVERAKSDQRLQALGRQVAALENYARLARMRYDEGVTSFLEVLDAERSLFNVELSQTAGQNVLFRSLINIYKAMGGGWVETAEAAARV
jgi:outer membrane protein TolC